MQVSHFPNTKNHHITRTDTVDWGGFVDFFRTPLDNATPKDALPLWSAVTYDGDYVEDAAVVHVHALTFDVDEAPVPSIEEIRDLPFQGIVSSSSSATADAPRWRLSFALTRPVSAREYRRLWSAVADALPFRVGQQSKNPSRGWYYPRAGADGFYVCGEIEGEPLDVDAILASTPEQPDLPAGGGDVDIRFANDLPPALLQRAHAVGKGLAEQCPTTGKRHELSMALSGALVSEGMQHEYIPAFVYEACKAAGFGALEQKAQNAIRTVVRARTGGAIAGFGKLREAFPVAAAAVNPDWGRAPTKQPLPTPAPQPAPAKEPPPADRFAEKTYSTPPESDAPLLRWVGANELSAPVPPPRFLVPHFGIAPGRPTLLAGHVGLGKTVLVQDLLLHAAAGRSTCWGLTIHPGPVLHLDYEMTQVPLQRRYQRLAYGHGIDLASCALGLCSMPSIYLSDAAMEDELCRATEGVSLAVIDNLSAAIVTSKISENDAQVRQYLDLLTRVSARTDCAFVLLAHERKPGKEGPPTGAHAVRGSSAIVAACGSVLSLSSDNGFITVTQSKTSLRQAGEDVVLRIVDVEGDAPRGVDEDSKGMRVERVAAETAKVVGTKQAEAAEAEAARAQEAKLREEIFQVLRADETRQARPGYPVRDLVEVLHGRKDIRRRVITQLVSSGQLVEITEGKRVLVRTSMQ